MIKQLFAITFILALSIIAAIVITKRFVINGTNSLPHYIYTTHNIKIKRNDYVYVCLNNNKAVLAQKLNILSRGNYIRCPITPLIKQIKGIPGDFIVADGINEIKVNNQSIKGSKPNLGSILPYFKTERYLKEDEYLIFTPHPDSFDSRYLGPISDKEIIQILKPIF